MIIYSFRGSVPSCWVTPFMPLHGHIDVCVKHALLIFLFCYLYLEHTNCDPNSRLHVSTFFHPIQVSQCALTMSVNFLYLLLEKLENELPWLYPCLVSLHMLLLINITYTQVAPLYMGTPSLLFPLNFQSQYKVKKWVLIADQSLQLCVNNTTLM